MSLGKISDYKIIADRNDIRLNTQRKKIQLMVALGKCPKALTYYQKTYGKVFYREGYREANLLVECDNDFHNAVPAGAKYKAFKNQGNLAIGYVSVNKLNKNLELIDTAAVDGPEAVIVDGITYELVGTYQGKEVYAHFNRSTIRKLRSGSHLTERNFEAYETSMRKGVISSGGTGADGIKFDQGKWVIKLTISIAKIQNVDNSLSPMATIKTQDRKILLHFNQLCMRH